MNRFLFLGIAISLSSCIPLRTRQDQLDVYRKSCLDYGFQWNTLEFAKCVKDQEYHEQKLYIENRKAQALENQASGYSQPQYNTWGSPRYSAPRRANTYVESYAPITQNVKQKVKQKVQNTTHIHQTHIQQIYNHPQSITVEQTNIPQPKSSPMDLPLESSNVVEQPTPVKPSETPVIETPNISLEEQTRLVPEEPPVFATAEPEVFAPMEDPRPLEVESPQATMIPPAGQPPEQLQDTEGPEEILKKKALEKEKLEGNINPNLEIIPQ